MRAPLTEVLRNPNVLPGLIVQSGRPRAPEPKRPTPVDDRVWEQMRKLYPNLTEGIK